MFESTPMNAVLPASDIDRAREWYREKLDLEPVVDNELGLEYQTGGHRFGLYPSEHAGSNQATAAGFKVDDVDETAAHLRERGVEFEEVDLGDSGQTVKGVITSPDGQKAAWFKDSEGNILAIRTP
jgi:catechol 2,3-dioxygenase-like lactoylglutathione lyase family enzyme